MGYIFGIVGIVLVGSLFCGFLYYLFNSRTTLDDAFANMKEDRRFGNASLEEYEDDERIEAFGEIIGYAEELRDIEFENAVSEINKFIARRSKSEESEQSYHEETGWQEMENVNVEVKIQPQVQVAEVTTTPQVQSVVEQAKIVQPQVQQVPVNQVVVEEPVLKPMTTDELYEQINDDFDDEVEEL